MSELQAQRTYEPPVCECKKLPHQADCPVAPFFDAGDKITLDSEQGDYHETPPFILVCPRGCRFHQFEHAAGYDFTPIHGQTEQTEIPLVCPTCGWSDKQMLPAIVGFNPDDEPEDEHFKILCPNTMCGAEWDRTDGVVDIWLERTILTGVDEARVRGIYFKRGQIVEQWAELSVFCPDCGHQCGETDD